MPAHRRAPHLTRILPVVLLAAALALTSCVPAPGPTSAAMDGPIATPHPLVGSTWTLIARRGGEILPGSHINLTFEDARITGSAGCNSYFADYTLDGDRLTFDIIGNTVMLCEHADLMTQEQAYLEALRSGAQVRVDGDRLEILSADGQPALVFERRIEWPPQDVAALAAQGWRLTDMNGETLLPDTTITLFFDAAGATGQSRGRMRGEAGCRAYEGEYEATDRTLRFPMTSMVGEVCASTERLLQEERYTTLLGGTERYRIDGDTLELGTSRGATLRFTAIPRDATPAPVARSVWNTKARRTAEARSAESRSAEEARCGARLSVSALGVSATLRASAFQSPTAPMQLDEKRHHA